MSLGSIVLCPPCLSLSLLFCLDLCTSRGAASSRPTPLALARGRGFIYRRRPLPEGGVVSTFQRGFVGRVLAAARGEQLRCGSRLPDSFARRPPGFRRDHRGPFRLTWERCVPYFYQPIIMAERDGRGHLRGQSCPTNSGSSSEGGRCSDRDRDGHDSGNSVVPSSTPGPQADRGPTAGR
jgi:hypothetical protein